MSSAYKTMYKHHALMRSVIYKNITVNHILPKTGFFGLHCCCSQHGSNFNHLHVIGPKEEFGEITLNNMSIMYAVQRHSKSSLSIGTNGKPVCDFPCVNKNNLHRCTVSELSRIIDQIFAVDRVFAMCLTQSFGVNP